MNAAAPIYGEEHELFRASVRKFVAQEIAPHHAGWEEDGVVDRALWRKAGEAGLLLTNIPAAYGGGDADFLTSVIMIDTPNTTSPTMPLESPMPATMRATSPRGSMPRPMR